jgi:hypothetical protein
MKRSRGFTIVLILLSFFAASLFLSSSSVRAQVIVGTDNRNWYKADLHTHHTYNEPLKNIINKYKETGYQFLVLSTKDMNKPLEWEKYSDDKMLIISGVEQSFLTRKNELGHIIAFRITVPFRETSKWTLKEGYENLKSKNKHVLLGINHPNDQRWTLDDVLESAAEGVSLFELNSERMEHGEFETALWDAALSKGARLYGTLTNDVHQINDIDAYGYVMIRAEKLTLKDMVASLSTGDFYAVESGCAAKPELYFLTDRDGGKYLNITSSGAAEIRIIADNGVIKQVFKFGKAEYKIAGDETYVRAEIIDAAGRLIFMQPFFINRIDNSLKKMR